MQVSQNYGISRPQEIAARCAALRTHFARLGESSTSPVAIPASRTQTQPQASPVQPSHPDYLECLRIERNVLRHDLATMKACADDAYYFGNGPTHDEIQAAEDRLAELNEMLGLDPEGEPDVFEQSIFFKAYDTAQHAVLAA